MAQIIQMIVRNQKKKKITLDRCVDTVETNPVKIREYEGKQYVSMGKKEGSWPPRNMTEKEMRSIYREKAEEFLREQYMQHMPFVDINVNPSIKTKDGERYIRGLAKIVYYR